MIRVTGSSRRRGRQLVRRIKSSSSANRARAILGDLGAEISRRYTAPRPSFHYKFHESWREKSQLLDERSRLTQKLPAKELAIQAGVAAPRLLFQGHPSDIPWSALPNSFAIKPQHGSAARAVFPIVNSSGLNYECLVRGVVSRSDILEEVARSAEQVDHHSESVLIEELILGELRTEPPYDWKVYAFRGKVGMIEQRRSESRTRPQTFKFYDTDGRDLGRIRWDRARDVDPDLRPPRHLSGLLEAASRVSTIIEAPFVRVDLLEDDEQVYLSELTFWPGGHARFARGLDEHMGRLWEEAEADLKVTRGLAQRA